MNRLLVPLLALTGAPAFGLEIAPPGGTVTARIESAADSVRLPRSPWKDGVVLEGTEGAVTRSAYIFSNAALTTLQLIDPVRTELAEAGYIEVFTCADTACGGFDFRFQLDLISAPAMFVDLGNFRYTLMEKSDGNPHSVALLASSSASAGYLHVTAVSERIPGQQLETVETPEAPSSPPDLVNTLLEDGHVVLPDLDFGVGSADLGPGPFQSLEALSTWLRDTPGARIVLVGHTDSIGSLDANKALSRRRAMSVLERLTSVLGSDRSQLQADGAGALSPIASNLDEIGRAANRRVEAVLLSVE